MRFAEIFAETYAALKISLMRTIINIEGKARLCAVFPELPLLRPGNSNF